MHTHIHAHTHTHGNGTEEQVFEKRKVFKEDLKELTEVEWWTEKGSWFQADGAWEGILELQEKLEGIFELIPRAH